MSLFDGLFNPSGVPGDNPLAAAPLGGPGLVVTEAVPGLFAAASATLTQIQPQGPLTLTTLWCTCAPDADGVRTDVTITLTAQQTALLIPGTIAGTITPAGGQPYPWAGSVSPPGPLDLDVPSSPPLVAISTGGTVLQGGGSEWVHVLLTGTASDTGRPVDLTQYPVYLAITPGDPAPGDFLAATWLTRTADPAGTYARLLVGPVGALALAAGRYRVYVQVVAPGLTIRRRAAGFLVVE
jgi:hypothetical protein